MLITRVKKSINDMFSAKKVVLMLTHPQTQEEKKLEKDERWMVKTAQEKEKWEEGGEESINVNIR